MSAPVYGLVTVKLADVSSVSGLSLVVDVLKVKTTGRSIPTLGKNGIGLICTGTAWKLYVATPLATKSHRFPSGNINEEVTWPYTNATPRPATPVIRPEAESSCAHCPPLSHFND